MRTLTTAMANHLAGEALTLATCWRITLRSGAVYRFTDLDRDLVVGGDTYSAALGYRRSAFASSNTLAVDDVTLTGLLDSSSITEADLRAGLWDGAAVEAFAVDHTSPDAGRITLRTGTMGEATLADDGTYQAELRGLTQPLQQRVGEVFQPECRADLGDARCRVPLRPDRVARSTAYAVGDYVRPPATGGGLTEDEGGLIFRCTVAGTTASSAPTYDGDGAVDGGATFEAETAWTWAGEVSAVASSTAFVVAEGGLADVRAVTAWFDAGVLVFETGANAGDHFALEVYSWNASTRAMVLVLPAPYTIAIGDKFRVSPGCDRRRETCVARYQNILNFRGEPDLPGLDSLLAPTGE